MLKRVNDQDRIIGKEEELAKYKSDNVEILIKMILCAGMIVWSLLVLADHPMFHGYWRDAAHLFRRFLHAFALGLILNAIFYIFNRKKIKELSRELGENKTDDREEGE